MPGKMDWFAYGLPPAQSGYQVPTVTDSLDKNIPMALVTETVGAVNSRMQTGGKIFLPVVNERLIVLGLIDRALGDLDPDTPVADVMTAGPTTLRPSTTVESALKRMAKNNLEAILVTSSDGQLLGKFRRPLESARSQLPVNEVRD